MIRHRRFPVLLALSPVMLVVLLASDRARAAALSADVTVTKDRTGPGAVHPGAHVTWDISVLNNGPDTATNVVWTDTLPCGVTFDEIDPPSGIICTSPPAGGTGTVSCTIPTLAASASSGPYHLQTDVVTSGPCAIGFIQNDVTVTSDTPDPDETNNAGNDGVTSDPIPIVPTLSIVGISLLGAAVALSGLLFLRR